ncbi:MAG: DUF4912 domain-containing protein [Spirochaetaceae bacterium]|jgi:hypothetical protein|nr:DUF4912 domain-containing protein [Spirochaetaceae bacterium]
MGDYRLTRSYLESLTTAELVKLADNYGVDIPPGTERVFIVEELLDPEGEDTDDSGRESEIPLRDMDLPEPAPVPKQYNITYIDVLLRDPLWVYTFWEIKNYDKNLHEGAGDFEGYHLKIVPQTDKKRPNFSPDDSFCIPVGIGDSAWYIGFPPTGGRFRVEIDVTRGGAEIVLAVSRPFKLPKLLNLPEWTSGKNTEETLVQLSGIDELRILRNVDRLSRIHQCGNS